jgi:hypothetical protein
VSEKKRRKGGVVIDIAVVIGVPEERSISFRENDAGIGFAIQGEHSAGDRAAVALQNPIRLRIRSHDSFSISLSYLVSKRLQLAGSGAVVHRAGYNRLKTSFVATNQAKMQ